MDPGNTDCQIKAVTKRRLFDIQIVTRSNVMLFQ